MPLYGKRNHRITLKKAAQMTRGYRRQFARAKAGLQPSAYSREILDAILRQKGCKGIRFYPGAGRGGKISLLMVGVDAKGNDLYDGVVGDVPFHCPPFCSVENPLNV